jgi:hypothetical protein
METLIIENVDKKKASLLKELALQLGLKAKSTPVKKRANLKDDGIITNVEIIKSIKEFESGKAKTVSFKSVAELKKALKQLKKRA